MRITFAGGTVKGFATSISWGTGDASQLTMTLVEDDFYNDGFNFTNEDIGKPFNFDPNLPDADFNVDDDNVQIVGAGGNANPTTNQVNPADDNPFFPPPAAPNLRKRFQFGGILQKYEKQINTQGFPTYELTLIDPRQILEGAIVILSGHSDFVKVDNLLNIYGYWEEQQFGKSGTNDAGILWRKILPALKRMTAIPRDLNSEQKDPLTPPIEVDDPANDYTENFGDFGAGSDGEKRTWLNNYVARFGAALQYQGVAYSLDLSLLPVPPSLYRVGGEYTSLLELIGRVCEDTGCDFIVELDLYTIRVRPISRLAQPKFGEIADIVKDAVTKGKFVSGSNGVEARNETSSANVYGGEKKVAHILVVNPATNNFRHFWGLDKDQQPIFSDTTKNGGKIRIYKALVPPVDLNGDPLGPNEVPVIPREILYEEAGEYVTLNALKLSRILGEDTYETDTIELRFAKTSYDAWAYYVALQHPALADKIGLIPAFKINALLEDLIKDGKSIAKPDFLNDAKKFVQDMAKAFANVSGADIIANSTAVWQFVKDTADAVLGKQFAVEVDFVKSYEDKETNQEFFTHEVTDGGYLAEDVLPLSLPETYKDFFRNQDGNYKAFCRYKTDSDTDLATVSPDSSLIVPEANNLFVDVRIQSELVIKKKTATQPKKHYVIVQTDPIRKRDTIYGNLDLLRGVLGGPKEKDMLEAFNANAFGTMGMYIEPPPILPKEILIPIKSNFERYGPWFAQGAQGKVKYEVDSTLTPWSCGGVDLMNQIAQARVQDAATQMKSAETAQLTIAEFPRASLGDSLLDTGPNITGMDTSYGVEGWTTTYRFQTYTSRFGTVSKNANEINKRTRLNQIELRRDLRQKKVDQISKEKSILTKTTLQGALGVPKYDRNSPHDMAIGYAMRAVGPSSTVVRQSVAFCTQEEALSASQAHSDERWQSTSIASITSLFRPVSGSGIGRATGLSKSESPKIRIAKSGHFNVFETTYDPYENGGDSLEFLSTRESYDGIKSKDLTNNTYRGFALSGPPMITGWGYDLLGRFVPGSGVLDSIPRADFEDRADLWKTGPMDLLWNPWRKTWTSHAIIAGVSQGNSLMRVGQYLDGVAVNIKVSNFPYGVPSGTSMVAGYSSIDGQWHTLSAGC